VNHPSPPVDPEVELGSEPPDFAPIEAMVKGLGWAGTGHPKHRDSARSRFYL